MSFRDRLLIFKLSDQALYSCLQIKKQLTGPRLKTQDMYTHLPLVASLFNQCCTLHLSSPKPSALSTHRAIDPRHVPATLAGLGELGGLDWLARPQFDGRGNLASTGAICDGEPKATGSTLVGPFGVWLGPGNCCGTAPAAAGLVEVGRLTAHITLTQKFPSIPWHEV